MGVKPILGTMTFGPQVNQVDSFSMLEYFLSKGHDEIDTAYVYNNGDSEKYIGKSLSGLDRKLPLIATKVNPRITGKLDKASIHNQLAESLNRLESDSVEILYLHFPDKTTPLHETLEACSELQQKGYFKRLGLSNYAAWEVVHIWHLCKLNGWIEPAVYQGLYNSLSRNVESELIPALRKLDISFYAYNPLAGGLLSGKYSSIENIKSGRFTYRPNYQERYWKKEFFDALDVLYKACESSGITLVEAAYRWIIKHSSLDGINGDGIIIGASDVHQLEQNLDFFDKGELDKSILDAFDYAWKISKSESPAYFRSSG